MKYFKRKHYLSDSHRPQWEAALEKYRIEYERAGGDAAIPDDLLYFFKRYGLHDCEFERYEYRSQPHQQDEVELILPPYRVVFSEVRKATGWKQAIDQVWLEHELYPQPNGFFQMLVMLEETDCEIIARGFEAYNINTGELLRRETTKR